MSQNEQLLYKYKQDLYHIEYYIMYIDAVLIW